MAERLNMAEGIQESGLGGVSEGVVEIPVGSKIKPSREEVFKNAMLPDEERPQAAEEFLKKSNLLEGELTEEQRRGIVDIHIIGKGQLGKNGREAGIYNYTLEQIRAKVKGLEELGFNKAQRLALIESGFVGIVNPTEFVDLDPNDYTDAVLQRIALQIQNAGLQGLVDENFLNRNLVRIEGLIDGASIGNLLEAQRLITAMEEWRIEASGQRRPSSDTDQFITNAVLERLERQAGQEGGSEFSLAKAKHEYLIGLRVDPALRPALEIRREEAAEELRQFRRELEQEQGGEEMIEYVRDEAVRLYKRVRRAKKEEEYGADKSQIIAAAKHGFPELWDDSPEFKELQAKYGGLLTYIYQGIVQEIDRTENKRNGRAINPFAESDFATVEERREEERKRDKKFTAIETHYGTIYRLAAETREEFPQAVLDFTKDRIFALSYTDAEDINKEVEQIREEAGKLLEQNRTRLVQEGQEISEADPYFLRAKALADSIVDVLGYERMLYKGGEEFAPKYKLRFAAEFLAHHDAIYLENPKAALEMHLLSTIRDGTYWFGHSWNVEKASEGEYIDYRTEIANEIIEYAATHELFLTDEDFKFREGDNPGEKNLKYGFGEQDNIERLLLDPDGSVRVDLVLKLRGRNATQQEINEALVRHNTRIGVFREIKERNDQEDGLAGMTPQERQQRIRMIIWDEMQKNLGNSFMRVETEQAMARITAADAVGDLATIDQTFWKWVEVYNKHRIEIRQPNISIMDQQWYPSQWDKIRMSIDRPTKVLDRSLSGDELMAMFEPSELLYVDRGQLSEKERKVLDEDIKFKQDEARFGFAIARSYQIFHMQDVLLGGMRSRLTDPITGKYIGKLYGDDEETKEVNRRLGLTDANGNVININRKVFRVFDVVQARLQIAIEKEETVINQAKARILAAANPTDREVAERELVNILVNAQFVGTHAMKDLGLVEGKLPVWSHNFLDMIDSYAKVLSNYGVKVGTGGVEITHNSKKEFYEIQERGRRALKAETDRAAREFMSGTYPIFEKDEQGRAVAMVNQQGNPVQAMGEGNNNLIAVIDPQTGDIIAVSGPAPIPGQTDGVIRDPQGNPYIRAQRSLTLYDAADDWGDQKEGSERNRISSKGAVKGNLQIVEPRYNLSSSGGEVFTEAIPQIGDLGFYPMLVWLGITDIRGLHNYSKRRDEVEAHAHHFIDVMDPVRHAEAQAAAYNARKALSGGKIRYRGSEVYSPGFFKEPFHGAYKSADWLQNIAEKARDYKLVNTYNYVALMAQFRRSGLGYSDFLRTWHGTIKGINSNGDEVDVSVDVGDLEMLRQLTYFDLDNMSKVQQDDLYNTSYGIFDYFQWYLESTKEVESNRIGRAPRNWEYNNTLKWYEFRRLMRDAVITGDRGFILRQGYSPEIASEGVIRMIQIVLDEADYYLLRPYERRRLANEGNKILSKALNADERKEGFVIPDEKNWAGQRIEVREALETIRRRGLLEFMREEGYKLKEGATEKQILGRQIPPLVQKQMNLKDQNKVVSKAA